MKFDAGEAATRALVAVCVTVAALRGAAIVIDAAAPVLVVAIPAICLAAALVAICKSRYRDLRE